MTKMTEHEAILLDMLFQAGRRHDLDLENRAIDALMRTVRATALRDAAKEWGTNGTQER
jgi:hypothetical protein